MPWVCERCDTVHTQNPDQCRNCGHAIFEPIGKYEVARQSDGVDEPDTAGKVQTTSTSKEARGKSSPDVALDGSIKANETTQSYEADTNLKSILSVHTVRAAAVRLRGVVRLIVSGVGLITFLMACYLWLRPSPAVPDNVPGVQIVIETAGTNSLTIASIGALGLVVAFLSLR